MTNKEYKEAKENLYTFDYWDYLNRTEEKELRAAIRERKYLSGSFPLPGSNNRASIRTDGSGYILTSYYTDVARIENGVFSALWEGYSATTMKHINLFRQLYGLPRINKRQWIELLYK